MQCFVLLACLLIYVIAKQPLLEAASTSLNGNNGNYTDISRLDSIRAIAKRDADKNEDVKNNLLGAFGLVLQAADKNRVPSVSKEDDNQISENILDAHFHHLKEIVLDAIFTILIGNNGNDIDISGLDTITDMARAADKNEDGKVTKEEYEQISKDILDALFQPPRQTVLDALFTRLGGKNGTDIVISGLDPVAAVTASAADENGDGKVTKEEFKKISMDILEEFFQLSDSEPEPEHKKVTDVRLPRHLVPKKYTLSLVPFLVPDNFTIKGYVEVEMKALSQADNITLHVADMTIENDTVIVVEEDVETNVGISSYMYDKDREFYIFMLERSVVPGRTYTIKIQFLAHLNDNLKGFYRSSLKDKTTGEDEYIAVTQFEPTDARRAFPCFDEPGMKAKFVVSLGRTKDMSSISNMKIRDQGAKMVGSDEYVWDHYDESMVMSTYLVAFVVSKFKYNGTFPHENNVRFRIWSRSDAVEQTDYARDIGPKILEFFESYFNVSFPLPKQDMIAIPDFGAGAMENWGLITFRETSLLFKEGVSTASNKQRIASVVSHELAHQWFGNLVTPSWWTDLWLNEGFASYMEYLGVEAIQPKLKLLEQFVVSDLQDVFKTDALESSHPISIPVKHPDEINEIFDRISYGKGASILRMMDKFLTTDTFRRGLTNYLRDLEFKTAEQDDLWCHLTEQAHRDNTLPSNLKVKTIMDTWTLQMGFPYITVKRDYEAGTAMLVQQRFLLTKNPSNTDKHDYRWWIPITFTTPGGDFTDTYNKIWMKDSEKTKEISGLPDNSKAVIFNVQQTGYYRVNYDIENWKLIVKQLNENHEDIHVINRAQIMDDALNLAKSGHLDYKTALSLTRYLDKETEYIPWTAALNGISYIDTMLQRTAAYGEFKKYMLRLITPLYNRLGSMAKPRDEHLDILLRKRAVSWACKVDHPDCVEEDTPNFNYRLVDDVKYETYCNAIARAGEKFWDFAWQKYSSSNVATEKTTILSSLGCAKEVWLLNRYLNMSLTPESGIRKQDGSKVISAVASNTVGRYLAFDFIRDKWDTIVEYFSGFSSIDKLVGTVASSFATPFDLLQLKEFQRKNKNDFRTATRAVKQAIEVAEANLDWMDTNYEDIFHWLKQQNHNS